MPIRVQEKASSMKIMLSGLVLAGLRHENVSRRSCITGNICRFRILKMQDFIRDCGGQTTKLYSWFRWRASEH